MANRRMFSLTIIDSDAFLEMPATTQNLYFHLSMRADDDGFVNNPRRIMRMIGAGDDDLKLLIAKRFLIGFQTGVVVIKHWKIHNYIQSDRYNKTVYQEEFAQLITKDNKSYTERRETLPEAIPEECIQDGYSLDTQVRLGKDRLGKVSKEIVADAPALDLESIVNLYHTLCPKLPTIKALNDRRKKTIKSWGNMDEITEVFTKAGKSDFLNGVNDRGWTANIDWLIKPENRIKVLEGRYENRKGKNNVTTFNDYEQRTTTSDEKDFMV